MRRVVLGGLAVALAACGGGSSTVSTAPAAPTSARATVRFEYRAQTVTDPAVAQAARVCVLGVGSTHIHLSWRAFDLVPMVAEGPMLWSVSFTDVPAGSRERIRVSDPNACAENATGAVTAQRVFANGTLLTERVDTPGSGTEPGFAFTVSAAGIVTP